MITSRKMSANIMRSSIIWLMAAIFYTTESAICNGCPQRFAVSIEIKVYSIFTVSSAVDVYFNDKQVPARC